jgi:gliding-associated putative ABC transporter substrate-binding component GldG
MRRRLVRINRMAQTALLAGVLVAGFAVAQRWFFRWDLTERKEYTLSPATKKLLAGLEDQVVVDAYFSRQLPPYLTHLRSQVQDVLQEYRALARGRLDLEFVDPGADAGAEQRMRALGIPQLQLEVLDRDQLQLSNVYLGIVLLHGGRQEVIPVVQDTGNLEYELTAALLRLTSPQRKAVGWIGEAGADPRARAGDPLRRELGRLYDVRELPAEGLTAVPKDVETIVVAGPRGLADPARFAIDQFIMRGGRAIFLVDQVDIPEGSLAAVPAESGVNDLLERYGVKLAREVIGEPRLNAPAAFSSGFMSFRIAYPWWVRVAGSALDREHPVTARLEGLVLPWAGGMEPAVPAGGGVTATVLAAASPDAYAVSGNFDFSPQPRRDATANAARTPAPKRPLAVLLTGRIPSFWRDKAPPAAGPAAEPATAAARGKARGAAPSPAPATAAAVLPESRETSVLVVGTSRFVQGEFLRQFPENAAFLLNAVDWMTLGPDLIGIRSRVSEERALAPVSERTRAAIRLVNIVGVPLLIALLGVLRLGARRRAGTES